MIRISSDYSINVSAWLILVKIILRLLFKISSRLAKSKMGNIKKIKLDELNW